MEEPSVWITKYEVVNKKAAKFTIDTLVEMLSRVGKPVRLEIG